MIRSRFATRTVLTSALVLALGAIGHAGVAVPAYSSNPGAAYTVYLDFGGFTFNGTWAGGTPGTTPAYNTSGSDASTFSTTELANIRQIWARTAEKYTGLNVNVTTIDPAVAAGRASTDATRQTYYDNTARVMHTVVGGDGSWIGGGGISYVGTTQNPYNPTSTTSFPNGAHTNWVFSAQSPSALQFVAEASAHENGHGFQLDHQSDFTKPATIVVNGQTVSNSAREYSGGDNTNSGGSSYAPIMGDSYSVTRGLWRIGPTNNGAATPTSFQNDYQKLLSNGGMTTFLNDGIGHSLDTATSLALSGTSVNSALAQGFITPSSSTSPTPLGSSNYTTDFFKFNTNGTAISLTLNAGAQRIAIGTADPGATFDGLFNILDANGTVVGTSVRAGSTLTYSFNGTLAAGTYYAQVIDYGGYHSSLESTSTYSVDYFTGGSYFFTGSGGFTQAVPEPGTWAALGLGALALLRRRRKSA